MIRVSEPARFGTAPVQIIKLHDYKTAPAPEIKKAGLVLTDFKKICSGLRDFLKPAPAPAKCNDK